MGRVAARMRKSFVTESAFKWFVARVDSYVLLKMKILYIWKCRGLIVIYNNSFIHSTHYKCNFTFK